MSFKDAKQCTAHSKRSGKLCRNPAMPNGKCRMHGGKAPTGFAAANFKHGRNSVYLKHLSADKQRLLNELADRLEPPSVQEEINLTVIHVQQLLELLDDSTMFEQWSAIRKNCRSLRTAIRAVSHDKQSKPAQAVEAILDCIDELFTVGSDNSKTWNQIHERLERIRKLQATNSKLRLRNLIEEQRRLKLVPVEVFSKFVMEVGKQFELSSPEIRQQQMHGLSAAFGGLPAVIRDPRP